jgi:hypothetical protein
MRRQRPVGQIERVGVAFLDEGAAHGSVSSVSPIRALPLTRRFASALVRGPWKALVRRIRRTVSSSTGLDRRLLDRRQKPGLPVTFSVLEGGAGSGIIRCELAGTHCLSEQGRAQNR